MTLFLEKHALGSLLKEYRRTENGHVTQHRMEESQGGLPEGGGPEFWGEVWVCTGSGVGGDSVDGGGWARELG